MDTLVLLAAFALTICDIGDFLQVRIGRPPAVTNGFSTIQSGSASSTPHVPMVMVLSSTVLLNHPHQVTPMRTLTQRALALFLILPAMLLLGCDSDSSEEEPEAALCAENAEVDLSVITGHSDGLPRFTWTPGCLVVGLLVEDQDQEDIWLVTSASGIAPAVTYGSTPLGATVEDSPQPLISGQRYAVLVFGGTDPDSDEFLVGETSFIAP